MNRIGTGGWLSWTVGAIALPLMYGCIGSSTETASQRPSVEDPVVSSAEEPTNRRVHVATRSNAPGLTADTNLSTENSSLPESSKEPGKAVRETSSKKASDLRIATWNLEWFYDHDRGDNRSDLAKKLSAPSRELWDWRLENMADAIAEIDPTVIALQEVENQWVVHLLRKEIEKKHGVKYRIAFIQGHDFATEQDVAILYKYGLVRYSRCERGYRMRDKERFAHVSKHVFAEFEFGFDDDVQKLLLCNIHLRATPEKEPLRIKQARTLHTWLADRIAAGENVILLGDFNSEHFAVDEIDPNTDIGIASGAETDTTDDDLIDVGTHLSRMEQGTHLIGKPFDRVLVSAALTEDAPGKDLVFKSIVNREDVCVRGEQQDEDHRDLYYQIDDDERDLSDHYPLVVDFEIK